MYQLNTENGYIVSLVSDISVGNITEEEYNEILSVMQSTPTAPEGYYYRIKTDLTFELAELPSVTEDEGAEAEAHDYEAALAALGVV